MGFRLVPKSVTLNDLERSNDRYLDQISQLAVRRQLLFTHNSVTHELSKMYFVHAHGVSDRRTRAHSEITTFAIIPYL